MSKGRKGRKEVEQKVEEYKWSGGRDGGRRMGQWWGLWGGGGW